MTEPHLKPSRPSRKRWTDALVADVRFAVRYFARHKATTVIIVAVLALGTGANTMIFSLFQSQFLRPAPAMPDLPEHVRIWAQERPTPTAAWSERGLSHAEVLALGERSDILQGVTAWMEEEVIIGAADSAGARAVQAQFVSPNYFAVVGVGMVAGLGLRPDAGDAPDHSAVISHLMAEELFRDAARAVGQRVLVNQVPVEIVGVAPPRFQGAMRNMDEPALWMPLSLRATVDGVTPRWLFETEMLTAVARLAPGASADLATAFARQVVVNALPDSAARVGLARTAEVKGLQAPPPGSAGREQWLIFALVITIGGVILLVAWMNVGSLMVAAAVGRRHEIAVRLSLGASRLRLLRQLVTESTLLALAGGALGLLMAFWLLTWNQKTEIDGVDIIPDAGTMLFVLLMAIATGIVFGLSPALHATRGAVAGALRDSGAGASSRSRLQRVFVVAQIALSQPLLVLLGTTLSLVISDYRPHAEEMSRHVITVGFRPIATAGEGQRADAVERLMPRIAERPEVLAVAHAASGFDVRGITRPPLVVTLPDSAPPQVILNLEGAAPGWFTLVDVPLILGRDVALADTAAPDRPLVIGSDLARELWGDANPIGRTLESPALPDHDQDSTRFTVVGVYDATARLPGMTFGGYAVSGGMENSVRRAFTAYGKEWRHDQILVRTRAPAEPFLPTLQRFLLEAAPLLPVTGVRTIAQIDANEHAITMRVGALAGAGGALALLLASLGLYGVVSLAVRQRTREIGIRIAVGAQPMQVARMFLNSGVRVSLVGLAIGLPLSVAMLKIALTQGAIIAPGVNPYLIGAVIAGVLLAVASAATWVPARRAARVDPATALRSD